MKREAAGCWLLVPRWVGWEGEKGTVLFFFHFWGKLCLEVICVCLESVVVSVSKENVWPLQKCTKCVSFLLGGSLPSVEVLNEGIGQNA